MYGPPYWPPQQPSLAEQIRSCVEGIEALSKMKKDLEDKNKEKKDKDKKMVEGLSKAQIFWIMLFLSPGVGPAMAYLWITSLHATMQIVQQSFK